MPVQFIGFIGSNYASEIHAPTGPVIDLDHIEKTARAHEDGGFDRALIAFGSSSPESILIATHAAHATSKLGLMIAHSQYHVHGGYVLENSDIAGFSRQEQQVLAALVRTHRRNVPRNAFDALPDRLLLPTRRRAALLRLAVLLHRAHESDPIPTLELDAADNRLSLVLSQEWLSSRPLLRADLIGEVEGMAGLGIAFKPFEA